MTISTLKNLPGLAGQTAPLPPAVVAFYANNLALGTGPNGTFLLQDFFGIPAGVPGNQAMTAAITVINRRTSDGTLSTLAECYYRMTQLLSGVYGGTGNPPTAIVIPPGPAQGPYATLDDALVSLIQAANAAIVQAVAVMGTDVTTINTPWTQMAKVFAGTPGNLVRASIDYATMQSGAQLPVTSFVISLASYGTETQQGMAADILESIANVSTTTGQAMVAAMREGRNDQALDSVGLGHNNQVPDTAATAPPQAQLLAAQYTVPEARAEVSRRRRFGGIFGG